MDQRIQAYGGKLTDKDYAALLKLSVDYGQKAVVTSVLEVSLHRQCSFESARLYLLQAKAPLLPVNAPIRADPNLPPSAEMLFQALSSRHECGSTIITTNLAFSQWTKIFGDAMLSAATSDRMTHKSHGGSISDYHVAHSSIDISTRGMWVYNILRLHSVYRRICVKNMSLSTKNYYLFCYVAIIIGPACKLQPKLARS